MNTGLPQSAIISMTSYSRARPVKKLNALIQNEKKGHSGEVLRSTFKDLFKLDILSFLILGGGGGVLNFNFSFFLSWW